MNVYQCINAVQADLAKTGIAKNDTNTYDKYKFRGIDAVYNALAPLLAKHGLCILPRMVSRTCEERQSQKGGVLFYVTVEAEFDFVAVEDGSKHVVRTFGEAMDRGDKATNKAMSAAYKYAAFQAFAIPTDGDNDADATSHEVAAKPEKHSPVPDVDELGLSAEQLARVQDVVASIVIAWQDGSEMEAIDGYYGLKDNDEKTAAWKLMAPYSKLRALLKANHPQAKVAA